MNRTGPDECSPYRCLNFEKILVVKRGVFVATFHMVMDVSASTESTPEVAETLVVNITTGTLNFRVGWFGFTCFQVDLHE